MTFVPVIFDLGADLQALLAQGLGLAVMAKVIMKMTHVIKHRPLPRAIINLLKDVERLFEMGFGLGPLPLPSLHASQIIEGQTFAAPIFRAARTGERLLVKF